MAEHKTDSSSNQADFQDIFDQASEEKAHHARVRANSAPSEAWLTRQRAVVGALVLAVPLLATLLAVNVFGVSLVDLMTPTPSPAVARSLTQEALDAMVKDIEGFREDYSELPERLAEVAAPSRGQWTYTRRPGGHYQVVLAMYGEVLTFDSGQAKVVNDEPRR